MTKMNSEATFNSPIVEPKPKSKIGWGIWIVISKVGFKLFGIIAKFTKLILAGASFAAYTYLFTWQFAAMIIAMLFVHEYGHFYAMKRRGMKTRGIYLIPFLGGAAVADEEFKSREDEAYIALMGPWFGFGISFVTFLFFYITGNPIFAAGASWMAMVNLLNLLPTNPLDGGRVIKSIAFSLNSWLGFIFLLIGLAAFGLITIWAKSFLFGLLTFIALIEVLLEYSRIKKIMKITKTKKTLEKLKSEGKELPSEIYQTYKQFCTNIDEIIALLSKDLDATNNKPSMTRNQMLLYGFLYLATCFIFYILIHYTSHIPGAKEAMEVLQ